MHEAALRRLEFPAILERLAAQCSFTPSREIAERLRPTSDCAVIVRRQRELGEARRFLVGFGGLPVALTDVRASLQRARKQGHLSAAELNAVADFAEAQAALGRAVRCKGAYPLLEELAEPLTPFEPLVTAIREAITPEGEVRDQATPELARLRKLSHHLQRRIREKLDDLSRSFTRQGFVQEALVARRAGRFVLPVKAEYRSQIEGIVHDRSGSGATVFIEPTAVIELNNRLRQVEAAAGREVERILADLSERVAFAAPRLESALQAAAYLDFTLARARLGQEMDAVTPVLCDQPMLAFVGARHPLLGERAVPVDVEIGRDFDVLIVTGPNTGGKTVALKTVGLLLAMVQSGLQIPCARAECGVFRRIFADIGDEQSIEQNLSTFSSHLNHLKSILPDAGPDTLVLLDEPGAGTDPEEGAALALALLDHFRAAGARTIVTTHYGQLKTYAYRFDRVRNASVEFDPETLEPAYRLQIGLPGRSSALAIAQRLGLPAGLIQGARAYLSNGAIGIEDALAELSRTLRDLERERDELERSRAELSRLQSEWQQRIRRLQEDRRRFIERERADVRMRLNRLCERAEDLVRTLREARADDPDAGRIGARTRQLLRASRREAESILSGLAAPGDPSPARGGNRRPARPPVWSAGERVYVGDLHQVATIIDPPDASGNAWVRVGSLRMRVGADQLLPACEGSSGEEARSGGRSRPGTGAEASPGAGSGVGELARRKAASVAPELHLRGLTTDEALWRLDKYLDDAFLAGLPKVAIVHGKGTGTLRQAVHEALRNDRRVESFRLGGPGEGSYGVTIACLRVS